MTVVRKKLIEVALPLEAINIASAREKSIRHGHPSTLHLWWARRPLAAARAVIFSQMVDDPSSYVDTLLGDPTTQKAAEKELKSRLKLWEVLVAEYKAATGNETVAVPEPGPKPTLEDAAADIERQRLFKIIEELVKWENTTNENVLNAARAEIWQSWRRACVDNIDHPRSKEIFDRHKLPAFHDPFAGGGALPLEAQRLGLEAYATDLNPVAVLINKAMIEIPPKFSGLPPINPEARENADLIARKWNRAEGLAEDVRFYGQRMGQEAETRIGHLYPKFEITNEITAERPELEKYLGQKLTVIAWLWARTVKSPNPAFVNVDVPLVSTFMLSSKPGKEAYIEPVVSGSSYHFTVKTGLPENQDIAQNGTKLARGANFRCIMSGVPIAGDYIKAEGRAGRIQSRMMAVVAEGDRGRVYLAPTEAHEIASRNAVPQWKPDLTVSGSTQYLGAKPYGMIRFDQLFTDRQLVALTTFSAIIDDVRKLVLEDARAADFLSDPKTLSEGGLGDQAYSDAVAVYLACGISRSADFWSNLCIWANQPKNELVTHLFGRQAIPMAWDYAEANPFCRSGGNFQRNLSYVAEGIDFLAGAASGFATQNDAATNMISKDKVVSTDPPYYDNIPYADLSDYFYVWLRRSLRTVLPDLFTTLAVPKTEELVAFAYRHDGKAGAEAFFLSGMTDAMRRLALTAHPAFPTTIYYAFKQVESDAAGGTASTGWETFLDAAIKAGFAIVGTWPMRTERLGRMRDTGSNALASSIILVCRPRGETAETATRREFLSTLRAELPDALAHLQRGNIAPVDLAQASIGPGMAVYSRYAKVLDPEGKSLTVREALTLINQTLDEVLSEQEGDFDSDTRWAVSWFDEFGFSEGEFGKADVLARAKVTAVAGLVEAKIVTSKAGRVRLVKPAELDAEWDPESDKRVTIWEIVHQLIRALESAGEIAAAELLLKIGPQAEVARELAYRLYTICERKKRSIDAQSYNGLVQSWPEINRLKQAQPAPQMPAQADMFQGV